MSKGRYTSTNRRLQVCKGWFVTLITRLHLGTTYEQAGVSLRSTHNQKQAQHSLATNHRCLGVTIMRSERLHYTSGHQPHKDNGRLANIYSRINGVYLSIFGMHSSIGLTLCCRTEQVCLVVEKEETKLDPSFSEANGLWRDRPERET